MRSLDQPATSVLQLPADRDIERRARLVSLEFDDIARIVTAKDIVLSRADEYVGVFFDYLAGMKEAAPLFGEPALLAEAMRLKREHLVAMVQGDYGEGYIAQRIRLGDLYGKAGLAVRAFLGAYHYLMAAIGRDIMARFPANPMAAFEIFVSLKKLSFFDIAIIVDVLVEERERVIAQQQEAIRELSIPVLQLRKGLLILPIIGVIDAKRARQLTDDLLSALRTTRAKVVVMDVTGVGTMDSSVTNHMLQAIAAARLMGASVIVSGFSPEVARSLAALGADLSGAVDTVGDLQGGIEKAERLLGYRLTQQPAPSTISVGR